MQCIKRPRILLWKICLATLACIFLLRISIRSATLEASRSSENCSWTEITQETTRASHLDASETLLQITTDQPNDITQVSLTKETHLTLIGHWTPYESWTPETFLKEYSIWCETHLRPTPDKTDTNYTLCACVPATLKGKEDVRAKIPFLSKDSSLEYDGSIRPGGTWKPTACQARQKIAIIVPFRDRGGHLKIFLNHIHPFLRRQQLDYTIFVIEQALPDLFNKASIMNIGFKIAHSQQKYDCYIFHDVDMLPEDDRNFYTCSDQPRHVGSLCDKFNYKLFYSTIFGGVIALTGEQFLRANGFSNEYYGWGGEDDDMRKRITAANYSVIRNPGSVSRFTMLKHSRDKGNDQKDKSKSRAHFGWKFRGSYYQTQGFNTLVYRIEDTRQKPLYTWILASVPANLCENKKSCNIPEYKNAQKRTKL